MNNGVGDFWVTGCGKESREDRRRGVGRIFRPIIIIGVLLGLGLGALPVWGQYGGGSGEPNEPFLIYDAAELQAVGANPGDWGKHFRLMADIDLSGYPGSTFNQIGYYDAGGDIYLPFGGVFDGNGYTISNFNFDAPTEVCVGLFGCVDGLNATVKNVGLEDPNVVGYYGVAALVGQLAGGTIEGCYVKGGQVTGDIYTGSLVGLNYSGTVSTCYNQSRVVGTTVTGGLIGYSNEGQLYRCYQAGEVAGTDMTGAVIGFDELGSFDNSFWDSDINGSTGAVGNIPAPVGLIGESTVNMQLEVTYTAADWDFDLLPNWRMPADPNYPQIWWEKYSRGTGESSNPYQIATAKHLLQMSDHPEDWDKQFILTGDPNLSGHTFTTALIAPDTNNVTAGYQGIPFSGAFDGRNYTIYNLTIDAAGADNDYLGLFGYLNSKVGIQNLYLKNVYIVGGNNSSCIGCLVGNNQQADINNCLTSGRISGGDYLSGVGGLIGCNRESNIQDCSSVVDIEGNSELGGLVGFNDNGNVINCFATCLIKGHRHVGGLIGLNLSDISDSHAIGSIYGKDNSLSIGGLVGRNEGSISNSYSGLLVTVEEYSDLIGGFVGINFGRINNCYTTSNVTVGVFSKEIGGLTGRSFGDIADCYSNSTIIVADSCKYIGGLVGTNKKNPYISGSVMNCYASGEIQYGNNSQDIGGLIGTSIQDGISDCYFLDTAGPNNGHGEPLSDPNMQVQSSFVGWDFVGESANGIEDIWKICEGLNYPRLSWQQAVLGDFGCPYGVGLEDLGHLLDWWLVDNCAVRGDCAGADVDGSGQVDLRDFSIIGQRWLDGR